MTTIGSFSPFALSTQYAQAPNSPLSDSTNDEIGRALLPSRFTSKAVTLGSIALFSIILLIRSHGYGYKSYGPAHISTRPKTDAITISEFASIPKAHLSLERPLSWMDRIIFYRSSLSDVSHKLKARKKDARKRQDKGLGSTREHASLEGSMQDLTILQDAVASAVRDVGVRGLLFEVFSDDFEYYVYNDENDDDGISSDSLDEVDRYWKNCASKHGVGDDCNEWDVWWTYHYAGAIITDMLLQDNEILWDGSSGEKIKTTSEVIEDMDESMAKLLANIQRLQATLPYVTQSSFHAQHALIWRYVEKSSGRLSTSYPWELALKFCRGDGSRQKGIVGRPVGKGVDHECFHGFGHAMFYAAAAKQRAKIKNANGNSAFNVEQKKEPFLVLAPHGGFSLSPEAYCDAYELCRGASPPNEKRVVMDPNDEASGNSYRICFEGIAHSVRLLSSDTSNMIHKKAALAMVEKEMKRCAPKKGKRVRGNDKPAHDRHH